jgi:signal transduction histidine kinase
MSIAARPEPWPLPRWLSGWRLAALVTGLAVTFGVLEAAQGLVIFGHLPASEFWPEALARSMPSWLVLAGLCPALFALAQRLPLHGGRWRLALPVLLLAGMGFVMLHMGGAALAAWVRNNGQVPFGAVFARFFVRYAVMDYFLYAALVSTIQIGAYHQALRERERAESRLRESLSEARLVALRARLDPHFLFNTLNSMSALAMTGERERLVRAIGALSEMLRMLLEESSAPLTTLGTELRLVDRYLEIQAIRFGPRLRVERDVDPATLDVVVPSLILQPLVENAFEHALAVSRSAGWVSIRAQRDASQLRLEVSDDGPGFAGGEPRDLLAGPGLGLSTTARRLQELYGDEQALACRARPEGGATVTLRIPWRTAAHAPVAEARP